MGRPKRCNHFSSSFEPVEQKAEMPKYLSKGSHKGSLAKYFLLVGGNIERAVQDWLVLSSLAVTFWRKVLATSMGFTC